jgi:hypothetical protein
MAEYLNTRTEHYYHKLNITKLHCTIRNFHTQANRLFRHVTQLPTESDIDYSIDIRLAKLCSIFFIAEFRTTSNLPNIHSSGSRSTAPPHEIVTLET